jgi:hypothetical protein
MRARFDASHMLVATLVGVVLGVALPNRHVMPDDDARTLSVEPRANLAFPEKTMFGPYTCTADCSGHFAGWNWARENRLRDADQCRGSGSDSFFEGCMYFLKVTGRLRQEDYLQ